ncbi:hypothetical protein [Deinococcus fonticola]|uniref:hypothetical protein n=1 Tax=Deinococcus fonticola TaxID=2528713 RepID=UPI00142FB39E|nr:hypothetical protein [Deinococcus fonticola]
MTGTRAHIRNGDPHTRSIKRPARKTSAQAAHPRPESPLKLGRVVFWPPSANKGPPGTEAALSH